MNTRQVLRGHQLATGASDDRIITLLAQYIEKLDEDGHIPSDRNLFDFIVEELECPPGFAPEAYWELPMFSEEDKERIVSSMMDEVADESTKDRAHERLEQIDLVETIGYALPGNYDMEFFVEMIQGIDREDYITGEFLRNHDDDGDDYAGQLEFAKRMGLIDEAEETVTDRGREFYVTHS